MTRYTGVLAAGVLCGTFAVSHDLQGTGRGPQPVRAASQERTTPSAASSHRAVLDKYCVACHNQRIRTAGLALDAMDVGRVGDAAEVWEKVIRKMRTAAMPPAGRPRPDKTTYEAMSSWLEGELDRAAAAHPNPGRPGLHRLNRTEYANAIRDLLALEIDGASLLRRTTRGTASTTLPTSCPRHPR